MSRVCNTAGNVDFHPAFSASKHFPFEASRKNSIFETKIIIKSFSHSLDIQLADKQSNATEALKRVIKKESMADVSTMQTTMTNFQHFPTKFDDLIFRSTN